MNFSSVAAGLGRKNVVKTTLESVKLLGSCPASYAVRLARGSDEIRGAQALRFEVFNLELKEGLEQSCITGRDEDPFDAVCDHRIVEHMPSQRIVGTYRLQTGETAKSIWAITASRNLTSRVTNLCGAKSSN